MPEYDNTNTGIIFLTPKPTRAGGTKMGGSINIEGREYWVTALETQTKAGSALKLLFNPKDAPPPAAAPSYPPPQYSTDYSPPPPPPPPVNPPYENINIEDIPF